MQEQKPVAEIVGDWVLLTRAREGEEKAWNELFESHSPRLLRLAAMMTGSADAARDCVQEAFVCLLHAEISHHAGSVRTYLSTIVYRFAVKENVRRNRAGGSPSDGTSSPDPNPFDLTVRHETEGEILRAIQMLAPSQKDILVLRFYGEYGYEEIATMTGLALGTVKSRIFYGVKTVRTMLQKRGVI